jgi:hypothetical protein
MKVKLETCTGNKPSEIFQSLDIKFAFVSKIDGNKYKQLHLAIKCRDFLGDCIWSGITGQEVLIYGFKFNASETKIDTDKLRLSLKFPNKDSMDNFRNNFDLLKQKDLLAGTSNSQWVLTDQPNTIIVEADSLWQSNVWKISLYSYYLKFISFKDKSYLERPEDGYAEILTEKIEIKLLSKIKCMKEVLSNDLATAHNNSGFVTIIKDYSNRQMTRLLLGGK